MRSSQAPDTARAMHGYLLIDKPVGPSSHSAVQAVRKAFGFRGRRGTKAGHAGTLDPFASGLLVVLLGGATRLMPYVVGHDKRYLVGVQFGASSTTDDIDGDLAFSDASSPDRASVEAAVAELAARTEQVPPAVSALHIDGKRAYARVRNGETVVIPPRPVHIDSIEVVEWEQSVADAAGRPRVVLDVRCGTGTYMRALARDLGELVGCPAFCDGLRRTEVGAWTALEAVPLAGATLEHVRPTSLLVPEFETVVASAHAAIGLVHGRAQERPGSDLGDVQVVTREGMLVCIAEQHDGLLRPKIVFASPEDLSGSAS